MHKVISIQDYQLTRNIKLKNSNTGTLDECFDDSSLISVECFDFMKVGKEYNCKIKLFGNVVERQHNSAILCRVISRNIIIGNKKMAKVLIERDEYYIPEEKLKDDENIDSFYFNYSRKDLIQVDDYIHADFL